MEFVERNSLFMAAKVPLTRLSFDDYPLQHRFLAARIGETDFSAALIHIPNRREGFEHECREKVLQWTRSWSGGPCVILGDTNTGKPDIDEEAKYFNKREGSWMDAMNDVQWVDAWRHLNGEKRVYSWRERRKGNGFRIDQGFVSPDAHHLLESVDYHWFNQPDGAAPSDHAALVLNFSVV